MSEKITLESLREKLSPYPQVRLSSAKVEQVEKILAHMNAGQTQICVRKGEPFPYCKTSYSVVEVCYHIPGSTTILGLVDQSTRKHAHSNTSRPTQGINTKIIFDEKLGISHFSGLELALPAKDPGIHHGTGIPGLYSKNYVHVFHYNMPKELYKVDGYVFKKIKTGKEIHFEWQPIGSVDNTEIRIAP